MGGDAAGAQTLLGGVKKKPGLAAFQTHSLELSFNQVNAPSAGWDWGDGGDGGFLLKLINATLNNRPLADPAGLRSPSPGPN